MRIVVDGTPLCFPLTGIGQYVKSLLIALADLNPDWEFILAAPYFPLVEFHKENIIFSPDDSKTIASPKKAWRSYWFEVVLPGMIRKIKPDVFWACDGMVPALIPKTPTALAIYDFVPELHPETMGLLPRYNRLLNRKFNINRSDWLIPISVSVSDELWELYGKRASSVVFPGVDQMFFESQRPKKLEHNYFSVLGTLEPRKNILAMLECIYKISEEGQWPYDLEVRIVGGKGWKDKDILSKLKLLEKIGVCVPMGYLAREELPCFLSNSRALLMPSLYEGFGMPIAEAIASGCPVVCSDIPVFREVVGDDESAIFHGLDSKSMSNTDLNILGGEITIPWSSNSRNIKRFNWIDSAKTFSSLLL